jgi:hypothetical protein
MSDPFPILGWTCVIAFAAAGLVQLVRLNPWVGRQMMAGKKPWVCDLCMSWWTSILVTGLWVWNQHTLSLSYAQLPAFTLTLLITHALGTPTSEFKLEDIPEIPDPEVEDKP